MSSNRLIILFVYYITVSFSLFAQQPLNYFFHHIDQTNGLLHNEVLSVAQDAKGFIWLNTSNGLQRYDGLNFKSYPQILTNNNDGSIFKGEIFADKKNNFLWLGTEYFLEKMPFEKNYSTIYNKDKLQKDTSVRFIEYTDNKNKKWLLNNYGVYYYDSIYKKYNLYHINIFPANYLHSSFIAADTIANETWVPLGTKIFLFDKKNLKIYSHEYNPIYHPLLNVLYNKSRAGGLRYVMKDSRKNIWVTTWGDTVYKYNNDLNKVSIYLLSTLNKTIVKTTSSSPILINCIIEDNHHTIWVATENGGLLRYNYEKDKFDYCLAQQNKKGSIQYSYKIFSIFQDKEENIWVGTDKGVSIFNPYHQYFKTIRHEENNPETITKNELISFIQTTNRDIFMGTWGGGMAVYDSNYNFKKNIFFKSPAENNFVWSFVQPDNETLWIGCQLGYLQQYNLKTGRKKTLHPPEIGDHTIRCMTKDNNGNIWIALQNGKIVEWNKIENKFYTSNDEEDKIKKTPVNNIFIDKQQQCWVSTENGFREFNLATKEFTHTWLPDKNNAKSISSKNCQGIEELNDSTLAVGTIFGGLNFFNKHTKTFSAMRVANGLPSDNIHALKKDSEGFLWFTTDYNLYKLNITTKKVIPHTIENGVINSSFIATNFYPLFNGEWLTFTMEETISFFPSNKEKNYNPNLKIEITGFKVFNKSIFIDSLLSEKKPVILSYKENFFTVEFAALNFSSLQQTNYYHRLIGIDKEWVNAGTKRSANYTDLHPGKYIFEIKATEGSSNKEISSFEIIITPPFWKTW